MRYKAMITEDELETFLEGIIKPIYQREDK